jgi:hypothetical protein
MPSRERLLWDTGRWRTSALRCSPAPPGCCRRPTLDFFVVLVVAPRVRAFAFFCVARSGATREAAGSVCWHHTSPHGPWLMARPFTGHPNGSGPAQAAATVLACRDGGFSPPRAADRTRARRARRRSATTLGRSRCVPRAPYRRRSWCLGRRGPRVLPAIARALGEAP